MSTEVFFSRPGQKCEIAERIKTDIKNSHERILLANYYLTEPGIKEAIEESPAPIKRFVLNDKAKNVDCVVLGQQPSVLMHHKFLIADNILWVGSFNFSSNATGFNWENVLRINDYGTLTSYYDEFKKMYLFGKAFTVSPWTEILFDPKENSCPLCNPVNDFQKEYQKKFKKCPKHSYLECDDCKEPVEDPFQHYIVEVNHVSEIEVYYRDIDGDYLRGHDKKISENIDSYVLTCKDKKNKKIKKCEFCRTVFFEKDLNKFHFIDEEIEYYEDGYEEVLNEEGHHIRMDPTFKKGGTTRKKRGYICYCSRCLYNKLDDYWTK
ncbi:MAG: phospholipase D-like domain-containing protein [Bacillus sp. (in: firmicutes)]